MNLDAKNTVALNSREQAQLYFFNENFGRAFAHFLVAFNLAPHWKDELKEDFTTTLCAWGRQLELQNRYKDLFDCYEQALEVFPNNEQVHCNLGAHLLRLGHSREAAHYFHQALDINSNYLPAYRNLQNVCNSLMEQWHFRMLNDSYRNDAYREAIVKKVRQGFNNVLDIGTGTGLLSLYAVSGDASDIHTCDYSPTMCAIAQDVFKENKVEDKIHLINKLSNDLKIPQDLPRRKSLVVTETMDCGLLGERLMQTLLHAWEHLLKPACPEPCLMAAIDSETPLRNYGLVIPFASTLWAVPVRCPTLAQRYYLQQPIKTLWCFNQLQLHCETKELYDSENLRDMKNCTFLSEAVRIFSFDFNNPSHLKDFYEGVYDGARFSFKFEGIADCLAIWFDVSLDEDIVISSSPYKSHKQCCWDQAIFQFKHPEKESLTIKANCKEAKLKFEVLPDACEHHDKITSSTFTLEIGVSADIISFLNNKELQDVLYKLPEQLKNVKSVLDLSYFPTLGLRFLQLQQDIKLVCVMTSENDESALKEFVKTNHLQADQVRCLTKSEFEDMLDTNTEQFDIIVNNVIEKTGELNDMHINNIPKLRSMLAPGGVFTPVYLTVMCQLIDCQWVSRSSRVLDEELTTTYKIAEYINLYKVSQMLDVDLRNVRYSPVTEASPVLQLSADELASNTCRVEEVSMTVTSSGNVTGVAVWFHYQLHPASPPLSTFTDYSHINQMVFVVDPVLSVNANSSVNVNVTFQCGILRIKVL